MTFSIVARCARTGALGVAVSSAVPAVGAVCPYLRAGVGAISTQSWTNPYLAIDALALLESGLDAKQALAEVLKTDGAAASRQIGLIDRHGVAANWTGSACTQWAGQREGPDCAVQGNMLVGEDTIDAMVAAFEATRNLDLSERLMCALEAGDRAGGDKRGRQSAALKVVLHEAYATVDLRVDEHPDPVTELRRVFEVAQQQLTPFIQSMPRRSAPGRPPAPEVVELLLKPPSERGAPAAAPVPTRNELARGDELAHWMGVNLTPDRVARDLDFFEGIAHEIDKLRELDLSHVTPVVVFDLLRQPLASSETKPETPQ